MAFRNSHPGIDTLRLIPTVDPKSSALWRDANCVVIYRSETARGDATRRVFHSLLRQRIGVQGHDEGFARPVSQDIGLFALPGRRGPHELGGQSRTGKK